MKYGVNTMVWTTRMNREREALLFRSKEWGFNGVELFLSLDEPANIPEMRQILDAARTWVLCFESNRLTVSKRIS
jgi:hypothetical protein